MTWIDRASFVTRLSSYEAQKTTQNEGEWSGLNFGCPALYIHERINSHPLEQKPHTCFPHLTLKDTHHNPDAVDQVWSIRKQHDKCDNCFRETRPALLRDKSLPCTAFAYSRHLLWQGGGDDNDK